MNKISLITLVCIAQYISIGFFGEGLMTILRDGGMSLEKVGLLRFMGFTLVFGFLWAPLVDKVSKGNYKGVVLVMHCVIIAILSVISLLDMNENLATIIVLALIISFVVTTSTIASNALFMHISTHNELSKVNALKFGGMMLGHIIGNGLTLIIYTKFGWAMTIYFLAFLTLLSALNVLLYPQTSQSFTPKNATFTDMVKFFKGKKAWLSVLFLQSTAICTAFGVLNPMLIDVGWSVDKIGEVLHIYGMFFGFAGSLAVGFLMAKFGAKKSLLIMVFTQAIVILVMLLPLFGRTGYFEVMFVCAVMYAVYVAQMTILSTMMMQKAPNTLASEYAVQGSANMFFQFIAFYLGMLLAHSFGYKFVIIGSCLFCFAIFGYFLKIYRHF